MAYCERCGVSFSDTKNHCPLCGSPAVGSKPPAADSGGTDFPRERPFMETVLEDQALTRTQTRIIYFEIVSIVFGSALFITLLTDVLVNQAITWSRYSTPAIAWIFLAVGMPGLLRRHPWILFAILAPTFPLALFLLDTVDGRLSWFLNWALPLSFWAEGCAAGCLGIVAAIKKKGLNVIAITLFFIACFCLGLELVINLNTGARPLLSWSPIVTLSAFPAAGMLFYLHFRIVRQASLRKLFRV